MRIACNDITFQYPGASHYLFNGLSFSIDTPGFNALFGPSGVGKTSLAKMMIGEIGGYRGQIETEAVDTRLYTYNTERLPGWANIGRHLERVTPDGKARTRKALIEAFGMSALMDSPFSKLSLGQKNRINLIRYLLQDFELLIMDESLANVDEITREQIILSMKALFPDSCFLYISHNVIEVSKFCRDVIVLRHPQKTPQTLSIKGLDLHAGQALSRAELDRTMLEIMNAA